MSQPERYEPRARSIGGPWKMVKCKDGAYVCFEQHEEIVAALAAENERLRKAGDAFGQALKENPTSLYHIHECVKAWIAAKEGRDAK